MWEELVDLVLECVLPVAVALCLSSQSLSVLRPMMEFRTSKGWYHELDATEPQWFWVAISFHSRGFTYISDNSFCDLRLPSLDLRSQTLTTIL